MDGIEKHTALQLASRLASGWPELEDINNAVRELRRLHAEVEEQCRLNGMGSEREAKLMAENKALRAALNMVERGTYDAMTAALARVALSKAEEA